MRPETTEPASKKGAASRKMPRKMVTKVWKRSARGPVLKRDNPATTRIMRRRPVRKRVEIWLFGAAGTAVFVSAVSGEWVVSIVKAIIDPCVAPSRQAGVFS
jgi:hypothetical protein